MNTANSKLGAFYECVLYCTSLQNLVASSVSTTEGTVGNAAHPVELANAASALMQLHEPSPNSAATGSPAGANIDVVPYVHRCLIAHILRGV